MTPQDLPEAVVLAPDRSDHMRHVRRLNRFLRKIERDPDELLEKVRKKMTQDLLGLGKLRSFLDVFFWVRFVVCYAFLKNSEWRCWRWWFKWKELRQIETDRRFFMILSTKKASNLSSLWFHSRSLSFSPNLHVHESGSLRRQEDFAKGMERHWRCIEASLGFVCDLVHIF